MKKKGKKQRQTWVIKFAHNVQNVFKEGILENRRDRSYKITEDGRYNDFPQHLISIVEPAPYTRAALEKRRAFISGKGLSDDKVAMLDVNDEYGFGELHRRVAQDFNYADRFAVWVNPARSGRIAELKHIPFEWVRWGVPDENNDVWFVAVNPYFKTSDETTNQAKYYPLYRFDKTNIAQDRQRIEAAFPKQGYIGHMYFYNIPSPRGRHYSRPTYFSAENWIQVDAGIGQFHERNLANNFFIGGIINKWGDPNKGLLDDNGDVYTTWGEEYAKEVESIASGKDNAGNFLINWYTSEGEKAEFVPWQAASNHEMFIALQDRLQQVISIATGVPPVLLGVQTSGKLGDVQEMRNAIKWTNENTSDWREKLEEVYGKFLDEMGAAYDPETFGINKVQDITDLPDNIFAAMTQAQKQQFLEDEYNIEKDEEAPAPSPNVEPELITPNPNGNGSDN